MKFRYIDIPKFVLQTLRGNYSVTNDEVPKLNLLYRICLAICFALNGTLKDYYAFRSRWYMLAACTPTYGQIGRVLSYLYGQNIYLTPTAAVDDTSYLYLMPTPPRYWYTDGTTPVYLGQGGNYTEMPTIHIPYILAHDAERYEQLIADLNFLTPFYINYQIFVD